MVLGTRVAKTKAKMCGIELPLVIKQQLCSGVRFSCFGNLFTIWRSSPSEKLTQQKVEAIVEAVEANGFVYVDEASLNEPYSGTNKYLQYLDSWWHRYFDYL